MSLQEQAVDAAAAKEALYADGFVGRQGAFSREWAQMLSDDLAVLFGEALRQPNGAVGRGPRRYYVGIHPERVRGFADIISNPWLTAVSEAVLAARLRDHRAGVRRAAARRVRSAVAP